MSGRRIRRFAQLQHVIKLHWFQLNRVSTRSFGDLQPWGHTLSYYMGGKSVDARTERAICPNGDKLWFRNLRAERGRVFSLFFCSRVCTVPYHSSASNCGIVDYGKNPGLFSSQNRVPSPINTVLLRHISHYYSVWSIGDGTTSAS